ncbi:MAG: hypothetical protein H0U95_11240 [Bacteroidetes bacterium]|nr:hypothetical protein [Bacteroidota bacterium]
MVRINGIIDDIKELKKEANYRSALKIAGLLENNRKLFLDKMDAQDYNFLLRNFEELSQTQPKDHKSATFIREYETRLESLLFHLNKII